MLLAVDPGIRGCGCALFEQGTLSVATYVKNPVTEGKGPAAREGMAYVVRQWAWGFGAPVRPFVFEKMVSYADRSKQSGDQNDLLTLCAVTDRLAGLLDLTGTEYTVSEWKGQMDKETCHRRIYKILSPEEILAIASVGAKDHNTLDAVGIGLHHLGRFKPVKVYPR